MRISKKRLEEMKKQIERGRKAEAKAFAFDELVRSIIERAEDQIREIARDEVDSAVDDLQVSR